MKIQEEETNNKINSKLASLFCSKQNNLQGSPVRLKNKEDTLDNPPNDRNIKNFFVKPTCFDSKLCWWDPPPHSLPFEFCENTSLHGLKYLGQSKRHLSERLFWLFAFVIGWIAAIYLISDVWKKYRENPVIVSFEPIETYIDQIPFPAITICNMNKVLNSKVQEFINTATQEEELPEKRKEAKKNLYLLDHVCSSSKSFTKKFNDTSILTPDIQELINGVAEELEQQKKATNKSSSGNRSDVKQFLRIASQSCANMITLCTWKDKVQNCSELFRPVETDFGKCCSFNMVPQTLLHRFRSDDRDDADEISLWNTTNFEAEWLKNVEDVNGTDHIRPRRQQQAGKSFGLSIMLEPDLDQYFCTTSDSVGFRMAAHLATENPHVVDYGIAVMPNSEVFVSIRPEITRADETIHPYSLEKRACYLPDEINLEFYEYYTPANCVDECIADMVYKKCECVRYYMPRDDNRTLCGPNKFNCTEHVRRDLAERGWKRSCYKCLPSCNEITYFEESTTTPLQSDSLFSNPNKHPYLSNTNASIVHIYFGKDSTYSRIRKELYGTTDLFANTGGLMGLCLGFSGLSAMEVLYFLTLRAWCRKRRKRTLGARVAEKFREAWVRVKGNRKYGKRESQVTIVTNESGPKLGQAELYNSELNIFDRVGPLKPSKLKSMNSIEDKEYNTALPPYSSIISEISPFYARKHWNMLEMSEEINKA